MDFKIDMTNVVKIVTKKDDGSFLEYIIDNGTIKDVNIIQKEITIEEKVDNLRKTNEDVKKISKLIEFEKAGILDKMARTDCGSVFDAIKDDMTKNPIIDNTSKSFEKEKLPDSVKESAKIMKLDEKMDEAAKDFRDAIAKKTFSESNDDELNCGIDKALTINNRAERIKFLKDVMKKIDEKDGKRD